MFDVTVSHRAKNSAKKLDHQKHRVVELLMVLQENPVPAEQFDIKKLQGSKDTYRARLGDVRVIYEVLWDQQHINVLVIERRETAYS